MFYLLTYSWFRSLPYIASHDVIYRDRLMDHTVSNERLLKTLRKKPEGHRLNMVLYNAIMKEGRGERLNSREFWEIHSAIFKLGPSVKYGTPEKCSLRD